ncbi:hypothetical protein PR048_018898 [Dryococelus australis]|uniref:Uncharacterized protein n=1 Tax=Dryococelus australis TaxID=614101 RepID=A0ABQ9H216_9NEOP|nr:hypothetical protein PR048_018898 [Dryococelus australis]
MQPLDVGFMKLLKTYYAQQVSKWLRHNQGRVVTHFQIAKLYGVAYQKAATMQNSINSFRNTGLLPCNGDVFSDEDFSINIGRSPNSSIDDESEGDMQMIDCSYSDVGADDDAECLFCTGLFSEDHRGEK